MENTKENLMKLLEEMKKNYLICSSIYDKDGDKRLSDIRFHQYSVIDSVIRMTNDESFFNTMWKIYFEEEKKNG